MAELPGQNLRNRSYDIDNVTWTEIKASAHCVSFFVSNPSNYAIFLRTDSGNSTSQRTLMPGARDPYSAASSKYGVFRPDVTLFYAKSDGGVGPLQIEEVNV
jgi:hypothetical protein